MGSNSSSISPERLREFALDNCLNTSYTVPEDATVDNTTLPLENHLYTQYNSSSEVSEKDGSSNDAVTYRFIEDIFTKVSVGVCTFGLAGNLLNLLVLSQKGLLHTMGRMEKFSYSGLTALAVSDMFFCLIVVLHVAYSPPFLVNEPSMVFSVYYYCYASSLINTFIMSSTWMTVVLAVGRFFVTRCPFRAREMIGMTFAARMIVGVFFISIVCNIPRFGVTKVIRLSCSDYVSESRPDISELYVITDGFMRSWPSVYLCYKWVYFSLCFLVPLTVLAYCNVQLILVLSRSNKKRLHLRGTAATHAKNSHSMTLTMVIIIIMYLFLVYPVEIVSFLRDNALDPKDGTYNLVVAVGNSLQACNFSCNFLLYCVVNTSFRRTLADLGRCRRFRAVKDCERFQTETVSHTTLTSVSPSTSSRSRTQHTSYRSIHSTDC